MKINDKIHGFKVKDIHELTSPSLTMYVMEHEKSGARLVYLDRDEENKTFSIAFKTLPSDSTGVFHILEHSVLCGSEKYRLKDPFVELLSGSLNTFLNAMTFSDKTMYPVASTNEKEFLSLAGVYLDAVFYPLAVKSELAFMQEGWHYEIDEEGRLSYKGVVLNEMRGDYSSPESVADRHIQDMLFSGTPYAHDSGGDPSFITELTYEEFCRAHKTYYHPSNSTVFLDGRMDIEAALALVASYLDRFDRIDTDTEAFRFPSAKRRIERREAEYEISESEDTENKTRLALAHLTFRFDEREKIFGAATLSSALFSSNESEIKKRILASGLCEDMQVNVGEGIYENYFEVDFINIKDGRAAELERLFYDTVADISSRGIDREELCAAINSLEFTQRERDYGTLPLGVVYAMNLMESYLYSDDPLAGLTFENEIKFLRDNIDTGFFESLLSEIFIENESRAALTLIPSRDLGERQREEERERLSAIERSLSGEDKENIRKKAEALLDWQNMEESEEEKSAIPRLSVSDISPEITSVPTEIEEISGATVITHSIPTSGIAYTELYFDVSDISEDEIFTAALLGLFLGNISTENYTAQKLVKTLKSEIGSFASALTSATLPGGETKVYFKAFISSLSSKKTVAAELLAEVLTRTLFTDSEAMGNILKQAYIASEESYASAGHRAAKARASAMLFTEAAVLEYYSGYEAHKKYKSLAKCFSEKAEEIREELIGFIKKYLVRERLTLSVSEDGAGEADAFINAVLEAFPNVGERVKPECRIKTLPKRREGIKVPAKVGYSSLVANTLPDDPAEVGIAKVASNLVSYEYLWSEIRVKGGAYGAGMSALRTGQTSFYSYRDPSPKRSIDVIKKSAEFLRDAANRGANIDKYIIGAIGDTSPYLTPRSRANVGTQRYLLGVTDEIRRRTKEEILSADPEKILRYAEKLEAAAENAAYCIVAPKDKLDSEALDIILEV